MTPNLMMRLRVFIAGALGNAVPVRTFPYRTIEEYITDTDQWLFAQ